MQMTTSRPISRLSQAVRNMGSTIAVFVLNLGISYFLSPFIVKKLGVAAYGFLGLSNNIIGYTGLLTIALNSMAGRYVSLNYHAGNIEESNRYRTSTYFANLFMAVVLVVGLGVFTIFMEKIVNIPPQQVSDVKLLFVLLFINAAIGLATSLYGYATFIKNRLDLTNTRILVGTVIRTALTVIAFGFFPAELWYMGGIAIIISFYNIYTSYRFHRLLTPELKIRRRHYDFKCVKEMTMAGIWNLLTSLSSILSHGLDLLLSNVFISAYFMGVVSLSKSIPWLILGLFASLANTFHPEYMEFYAQKNMDKLKETLLRSIRILGLFTAIPCSILFSYGDIFYTLWLPAGQDIGLIYRLTCITMTGIIVTLPTQALWYIFTMTNKVKQSSLNLIKFGIVNVTLIVIAMHFINSDLYKVYALVMIQASVMFVRFICWLPSYGAKVLGLPRFTLLRPTLLILLSTAILTMVSLTIKNFLIHQYSWGALIGASVVTTLTGIVINYGLSLTEADRLFIKTRILKIQRPK